MVFSSMIFIWVFLPITFIGSRIIGDKFQNIWLLAASLLFYAWGEPVYILLMLLSIIVNWGIGLLVDRFSNKPIVRTAILALGVTMNLLLLGYYKYFGFSTKVLQQLFPQLMIEVVDIALPIGISFFTFQAMSYIIDLYRQEYPVQKNLLNVALYISFFPQLIAGPIVKYRDINEQMVSRTISYEQTASGIRRFIYGLSKKVLIANTMAQCADEIFALPLEDISGSIAWGGAILYTLQIYYDFSGYSDMAIGLGRMLGFEFLENFNYPYISRSIQEFWRRWHISLSSWFREYVYIPLGGNRKGSARTYINLSIVFFCTGLWHGASWNYVIWGLYHGFFLIIERMGVNKVLKKFNFLSWVYTTFVVIVGWMLFRIEDLYVALRYIKRMLFPWEYQMSRYNIGEFVDNKVLVFAAVGIIGFGTIQILLSKAKYLKKGFCIRVCELAFCSLLLILCILSLASNTYNPFIYFRF